MTSHSHELSYWTMQNNKRILSVLMFPLFYIICLERTVYFWICIYFRNTSFAANDFDFSAYISTHWGMSFDPLWYSSHILPASKWLDFEWRIIASGAWVPFSMSYGSLSSSVITWENEFNLKSTLFPSKKSYGKQFMTIPLSLPFLYPKLFPCPSAIAQWPTSISGHSGFFTLICHWAP